MNQASTSSSAQPAISPADIAASCRVPLMLLFVSGAVWLVIGSAFALVASLKFHSPNFLADEAWLTYGRVRPAFTNSMLYGFCIQAGLGVALWMFTHLGQTTLVQRWLVTVGGVLWNLGVTIGVVGILVGRATGFETLEMPGRAAFVMFLGYLLMAVWLVATFHQRRERRLYVSHWFVMAALFWFPWIYSTANLLLLRYPVRGMAQAVIAWWYGNNLQTVWLGLVGLAAVFYVVPKLLQRELHSRYLALLTFWMLILFGSWGGIPNSAPVPAWMPAVSTVATVLLLVPLLAVALNVRQTVKGASLSHRMGEGRGEGPSNLPLRFILLGVAAFVVAGLMNVCGGLAQVGAVTDLTWFTVARTQLNFYGFFTLVMFGAIYRIVPQITDTNFPSLTLIRAHWWLCLLGVVLVSGPLAVAGILEGFKLQNPAIPFSEISKGTLHFLRASTTGDLLLAAGHIIFLVNVVGLVNRYCRAKAEAAYSEATRDLFATEAKA
jgi:cytochrome c oxidase cbb3-type subunit 1